MRRKLALSGVAGALIIVAIAIGAPRDDQTIDFAAEIDAMQRQIPALESQIADLERQIRNMAAKWDSRRMIMPQYRAIPRSLPEGARPFEFNGMTFYICPLSSSAQQKTSRSR
ncbi:MAG: hypothetical protein JSU94_05480 [Phycisphaerales bacterium]|nr:MAG: hypothetical protein JSU94_05480 [Phycisphaerales bacterium]